jgi:hypothetical protein
MLLTRAYIEKAMQLDVNDIQCALMVTEFYEDAAYLSDVSFVGMNEMSQFVYKATWLYTTPEAAAPQNIYISVRYSPNTYGIDFYADY